MPPVRVVVLLGTLGLLSGCPDGASSEDGEAGPAEDDDSAGTAAPDGLGCDAPPSCDEGELVGSLRVSSEEDMAAIAGHTSITGWLEVYETEAQCLEFLACLEEVGRDVTVFGNAQLETLDGLNGLQRLGTAGDGNVIVSTNASLTNFDGFESLTTIPGSLHITKHDRLTKVSGFGALQAIGIDITIQLNPLLEDLVGLHDLQEVLGRFIVTQNPELCITEIEEVGADLAVGPDGGSTASNKGC